MLKIFLTCLCVVFWIKPLAAQQSLGADYVLSINGVDHELVLGQNAKIKLKSGQDVSVLLKKQKFGRFSAGGLSFEYPGTYSVASTPVEDGVTQHIVVTGLGTVMLIQHYETTMPSGLLNLMFDKMVEEPKAMGLKIGRDPLSRKISNGQSLEGVSATYKGGDDDVTIDITATQTKSGGYLVLTLHDNFTAPEEKNVVEQFWETLSLTP
jgi:hypothetical protein